MNLNFNENEGVSLPASESFLHLSLALSQEFCMPSRAKSVAFSPGNLILKAPSGSASWFWKSRAKSALMPNASTPGLASQNLHLSVNIYPF